MNNVLLFLYALAIRFFLFEFYLFSPVRTWGRRWIPGMDKFLDCPFCNGFWVGVFLFGSFDGLSYDLVLKALAVGYLAFFTRLTLNYMADQIEPQAGLAPDDH